MTNKKLYFNLLFYVLMIRVGNFILKIFKINFFERMHKKLYSKVK